MRGSKGENPAPTNVPQITPTSARGSRLRYGSSKSSSLLHSCINVWSRRLQNFFSSLPPNSTTLPFPPLIFPSFSYQSLSSYLPPLVAVATESRSFCEEDNETFIRTDIRHRLWQFKLASYIQRVDLPSY